MQLLVKFISFIGLARKLLEHHHLEHFGHGLFILLDILALGQLDLVTFLFLELVVVGVVNVNKVLVLVVDLELRILVHDRALQEHLHVSNRLDQPHNVQFFVEAFAGFAVQVVVAPLVAPEEVTADEGLAEEAGYLETALVGRLGPDEPVPPDF